MQVLGSDMAPADARRRFFGFWRLIGELGGLVSPALFGFAAEQIGYAVLFAMVGLCSLATAMLLAFSVRETVTRENFSAVPAADSQRPIAAAATSSRGCPVPSRFLDPLN